MKEEASVLQRQCSGIVADELRGQRRRRVKLEASFRNTVQHERGQGRKQRKTPERPGSAVGPEQMADRVGEENHIFALCQKCEAAALLITGTAVTYNPFSRLSRGIGWPSGKTVVP